MTEPAVPEADLDSDRMVDSTETLRDDDVESMPLDRGREPGEGPLAADRFGTTPNEEAQGESLDARLAQEEPEVNGTATFGDRAPEDTQVGRLVEPDEGAHTDLEKDVVASDVGRDAGNLSAEEAAMHLEPE
jgi:uncharacterized protein DUF5709